MPVVTEAMESNRVTGLWDDLLRAYNALPLVPDVALDLPDYVCERANAGMFALIGEKEADIRDDPLGASSSLVQGVFGWRKAGRST